MKAIIYARVSATDQSTDNQLPVLEAWAKQRGFEVVTTYSENESAWCNGHQVELKRLLEDARRQKFGLYLSKVYCYRCGHNLELAAGHRFISQVDTLPIKHLRAIK